MNKSECRIICVGKRRDGGSKFWCIEHKADATAKYGRRAASCRYAHFPPLSPSEILELDVQQYSGGIALWGAVPPIYDTTSLVIDRGVHVHARDVAGSDKKDIDNTFRFVRLFHGENTHIADVSELDAIYYMVSTVFGFKMKYVQCSFCGFAHLDKDWFSVHVHRRHLCAGCGKQFRDDEKGIGNPAMRIRKLFPTKHKIKRAEQTINFKQKDYPGGIQIWGSNPALLWTSRKDEEAGIHIHAFGDDVSEPELDDTYSNVVVDGIRLSPSIVRVFMAQSALPHIEGRVISVRCAQCGLSHFDHGEAAFTPHETHICRRCSYEFKSNRRVRKTIGNPVIELFECLSQYAVRAPQRHASNLLPETL